MRTNLQLLIILRGFILDGNFQYGLCITLYDSRLCYSQHEEDKLRRYINRHKPKDSECEHYRGYYWPSHLIAPRLNWLNHHIKLLTK